jgi:hypothetical protein
MQALLLKLKTCDAQTQTDKPYSCKFCGKVYQTSDGKRKHEKKNKCVTENIYVNRIAELEKTIDIMRNNPTIIHNTINNIQQTYINIKVNPFSCSVVDYIDFKKLLQKSNNDLNFVFEFLTEQIYFNPIKPENMCIRITDADINCGYGHVCRKKKDCNELLWKRWSIGDILDDILDGVWTVIRQNFTVSFFDPDEIERFNHFSRCEKNRPKILAVVQRLKHINDAFCPGKVRDD